VKTPGLEAPHRQPKRKKSRPPKAAEAENVHAGCMRYLSELKIIGAN
jgi:hypothetical protein